jgi:hypothetical protein
MRTLLCSLSVLSLIGCGSDNPAPVESAGRLAGATTVLAPGESTVSPADSRHIVTLIGVANDSRCPINATCVWEGDADVRLSHRVGLGPDVLFTLRVNRAPRDTVIGVTRIALDSLTPYPELPATGIVPG